MQINSINNAQSFGMACKIGKGFKNAMKKAANSPESRIELEEVKTTCAALDSMPQEFYVNILKDYPNKVAVKLVDGNETVSVRLYKKLKPNKVLKDMCKDISIHAQQLGREKVVLDAINNDKAYFENLAD